MACNFRLEVQTDHWHTFLTHIIIKLLLKDFNGWLRSSKHLMKLQSRFFGTNFFPNCEVNFWFPNLYLVQNLQGGFPLTWVKEYFDSAKYVLRYLHFCKLWIFQRIQKILWHHHQSYGLYPLSLPRNPWKPTWRRGLLSLNIFSKSISFSLAATCV